MLAGFAEEVVDQVAKLRLGRGGFGGFLAGGVAPLGEERDHAVAHVHLVVEIAALQAVELPVEFGDDGPVGEGGDALGGEDAAVDGADEIVAHEFGIVGGEGEGHIVVLSAAQGAGGREVGGALHEAGEDGALAGAVFAAEHVDIGPQCPVDGLSPVPKTADLDAADVSCVVKIHVPGGFVAAGCGVPTNISIQAEPNAPFGRQKGGERRFSPLFRRVVSLCCESRRGVSA